MTGDRGNLFSGIPGNLPGEVESLLVSGRTFRLNRIVSRGQCGGADDWYDQDEAEWVALVSGRARLRFEDEIMDLEPGDWVRIPPHRRHRVDWTDPSGDSVWLALYFSDP